MSEEKDIIIPYKTFMDMRYKLENHIIRCKNCKYRDLIDSDLYKCSILHRNVNEWDFCSWAKKVR